MRRCSYCNSVEHDKRKCPHYEEDVILLYDITSLYINIVIDSLVHYGIGPTALASVSDPSFHFYKNNPDPHGSQMVWTHSDRENPELFSVSDLELGEVAPLNLPNGSMHRGQFSICFTHLETESFNSLSRDATPLPYFAKVRRGIKNWLLVFPEGPLRECVSDMESILWRESVGTDRGSFLNLLKGVRGYLDQFWYNQGKLKLMPDVVIVSGIPQKELRIYYDTRKSKILQSSLDTNLEKWYNYYSKKIRHNHFKRR